MNLTSIARSLSGYKVLEEVDSKFNGHIRVVRQFGETQIVVDGLTQSGDPIRHVWQKTVSRLRPSILTGKSGHPDILILGLGSGTLATMLSRKLPQADITGIEIDPEMIRLGRSYLGLNKARRTKIIIGDAAKIHFNDLNHQSGFDLIFVDLYQGKEVPAQLDTVRFFRAVLKSLAPDSQLFINRLFYDDDTRTAAQKTISTLENLGHLEITLSRVFTNLIIHIHKS